MRLEHAKETHIPEAYLILLARKTAALAVGRLYGIKDPMGRRSCEGIGSLELGASRTSPQDPMNARISAEV